MIVIKGMTDTPCILTDSKTDVVQVRFQDGSFQGSIAWTELIKIIRRKSNTNNIEINKKPIEVKNPTAK